MNGLNGKVAIVTGGCDQYRRRDRARVPRSLARGGVIADIDGRVRRGIGGRIGAVELPSSTAPILPTMHRSIPASRPLWGDFGGVDILINNACTMLDKGLQSSRDEWLAALNVNVVSGARFVRPPSSPICDDAGGGAIVNFSSIAGKQGQRGRALYPASKAAILQLTRNEAMELAVDKIRVNTVSPGWTWSTDD